MRIVPAAQAPRDRLDAFIRRAWHADFVVAHDEQIRPAELAGFVALNGDVVAGHAGYRLAEDGCELVAIAVEPRRSGIGSALMDAVVEEARRRLKPDLPPTGEYDIPMRDELDLELRL